MAGTTQRGKHFSGEHLSDSRFSRSQSKTGGEATHAKTSDELSGISAARTHQAAPAASLKDDAAPYGGYGAQYRRAAATSLTGDNGSFVSHAAQSGHYAHANIDSMVSATNAPLKVSTTKRSKRSQIAGTIAAIFVLLGIGIGAWWLWNHRTINILVNGMSTNVRAGTSIEEFYSQGNYTYQPGNLLSLTGEVLEQGGGHPYSVRIDGNELGEDERKNYKIGGGVENIEFADGADTVEDYTVTYREDTPRLVFEGEWGSITYIAQWGQMGKTEVRTGAISGETVDGDIVQELKDCIVRHTVPQPDNGERLVALTFDDGPSAYTPDIIEILNRYGAHATFFNIGENVDDNPAGAKAVVDSGNQLCSHTYHHDDLTVDDTERYMDELTSAFNAIKNASGTETSIIRPPYGEFSRDTWLNSKGTISASILWTQDSEDWKLPGVDTIVANALAYVESGSIILMHDGGGNRDQTLEALPRIIETLQADGYKIVTINELIASDSSIPSYVSSGNATLPEDAVWPSELA